MSNQAGTRPVTVEWVVLETCPVMPTPTTSSTGVLPGGSGNTDGGYPTGLRPRRNSPHRTACRITSERPPIPPEIHVGNEQGEIHRLTQINDGRRGNSPATRRGFAARRKFGWTSRHQVTGQQRNAADTSRHCSRHRQCDRIPEVIVDISIMPPHAGRAFACRRQPTARAQAERTIRRIMIS